ncbi:MAG: ABC transporter ATP-binding protein [Deltaproteobacteria bacterium]|nr:ABC transporter ATP-binding protein [Deltaproteobacteria bacterium]
MPILETKGLTKYFGGLPAVRNLDLVINEGEIVGLIGPNGAGKTTAFNVISGYFKPTEGQVFFKGEEITGLKMDKIAKRGLVRTFQHSTLFTDMTVMENMVVARHLHTKMNFFADMFNTSSTLLKWQELKDNIHNILDYMGLSEVEKIKAGSLPYGYQRLLGVAIALAVEPTVILLDEPVTGMNNEETKLMVSKVEGIRERGVTVLLVEHHMRVVMNVCDRIYVLNFGEKMAEGLPEEISKNEEVIKAYLGAQYASRN